MTFSKALGLRAVFTDHSLFGFARLSAVLSNKALSFVLNLVDNFVCVSQVAKKNTILRGAIRPDQVFVIPNAIDSLAFTPDPSYRDPNYSEYLSILFAWFCLRIYTGALSLTVTESAIILVGGGRPPMR